MNSIPKEVPAIIIIILLCVVAAAFCKDDNGFGGR